MGMTYAIRRSNLTVKTFDHISVNYKKPLPTLREQSPEPHVADSTSRERIYLQLVQETSKLNPQSIFERAPEFFKHKIGLTGAYVPKGTSRTSLESKSSPSLYRQKTCVGCASSTHLQDANRNGPEAVVKTPSSFEMLRSRRNSQKWNNVPLRNLRTRTDISNSSNTGDSAEKPEWKSSWNYVSTSNINSCLPSKLKVQPNEKGLWDSDCVKKKERFISHSTSKLNSYTQKTKPSTVEETHCVFAVNGAVVSFKGSGSENFTNWFASWEDRADKCRNILRELDFSGFSNREIRLKLLNGRKLLVEAIKPDKSGVREKKLKHILRLPQDLDMGSILISRNLQGHLIIERKD